MTPTKPQRPYVFSVNSKKPSSRALLKAVKIIKTGGLIAYPTDTVYGLGANALDQQAVLKIFKVKKRLLDRPLPVAISGIKMAEELAYVNEIAKKLMKAFWPGALTIVLYKKPRIPSVVTGGKSGVGLRAPNHKVPLTIIKLSNLPIITTSANKHRAPPCVNVNSILNQFHKEIDLIINGGTCKRGVSTIIDLCRELPVILRRGLITKKMIENVIGSVEEL